MSSGFVLRTVAGASLVQRSPSAEFLVIVLLGSLFIVASKRLSEIKNSEMTPRKVTNDYTKDSLSRLLLIFSTLIIATYFLFCECLTLVYSLHNLLNIGDLDGTAFSDRWKWFLGQLSCPQVVGSGARGICPGYLERRDISI